MLGIQFSITIDFSYDGIKCCLSDIFIYTISKSQDHGDCYFLYIYSVNDISCASGEMGNRSLFISEWP